jgi:NAD(P)-dependent dehydrogenase (short-subunit alcohol dehydrogenase family)
VARLVLFLASEEASYITGAEVAIDGGGQIR